MGTDGEPTGKAEAGAGGRCRIAFDGRGGPPLADLAADLLRRQREAWPELSDGYSALEAVRTREIRGDGWRAVVQFNPRRIVSSGARLDPETVRRRPCFLCPENLPPEQEAIGYRGDHLILCNPMPIFPGHWTIVHRRHLPQSIRENLEIFLRLAADFGPGITVFYNGPRAGASAPDHLHFQAAPSGRMPVEAELLDPRRCSGKKGGTGAAIFRAAGLGRGMLVLEGREAESLAALAVKAIAALGGSSPASAEPPLNLLARHTPEGWRLILFPRRRHRPEAYFREGAGRLLVSPGAVDMAGVIIAPREADFLKLTPALVSEIYREVAFDDEAAEAVLARLT